MQTINIEILKQICKEFVNNPQTIIAIQNDWYDMLIKEVPITLNKQCIMQALETTVDKYVIQVFHNSYHDTFDVYIAISNNNISIATNDWLLW